MENEQKQGVDNEITLQKKQSLKHRGEKEFLDKQSNDEITALPADEDLRGSHLSDGNTETDRNDAKLNHTFSDTQSNTVFIAGHPEEKGDSNDVLKVLGSADDAIHSQGKRGETSLHYAIADNNTEVTKKMSLETDTFEKSINAQFSASLCSDDVNSLIRSARVTGNIKYVEDLIKLGPDLTTLKDPSGNSLLHIAAMNGSVKMALLLLEHDKDKVTLDSQNKDGFTPLHCAIYYFMYYNSNYRYIEFAKLLIEHKANIALKDKDGQLPLHLAAQKIRDKDFVQLLINSETLNEKVSYCIYHALNALHIAAQYGNIEVVELLIKNNIDINAKSEGDKKTALMYAAIYGKENVVKFLLNNTQIDINAQDDFCKTALHLACAVGHNVSIIKLLLTHPNIDRAIKNICGRTALSYALSNEDLHANITDVISLFNKYGVFVSATDIEGALKDLRFSQQHGFIKPDAEAMIQIKAFLDELQEQLGEKKQNTKVVVLIAVTSMLVIAVAEAITLVYVKNKSGKIVVTAILMPLFVLLPIFFVLFLKHRGEKEFLDKQSNDEITALTADEDLSGSHLSDGNTETDRNDAKLNPTFSDTQSNTVFIAGHSEEKGDSNDVLNVFGSADDAIHRQGKRGETPLHYAIADNNTEVTKMSLETDTFEKSINAQLPASLCSDDVNSLIRSAIVTGNINVCRRLN